MKNVSYSIKELKQGASAGEEENSDRSNQEQQPKTLVSQENSSFPQGESPTRKMGMLENKGILGDVGS